MHERYQDGMNFPNVSGSGVSFSRFCDRADASEADMARLCSGSAGTQHEKRHAFQEPFQEHPHMQFAAASKTCPLDQSEADMRQPFSEMDCASPVLVSKDSLPRL